MINIGRKFTHTDFMYFSQNIQLYSSVGVFFSFQIFFSLFIAIEMMSTKYTKHKSMRKMYRSECVSMDFVFLFPFSIESSMCILQST